MDRKFLGKRIREERLRIGLTQEQIAERINVSTTYVGFIERGERSVTLEKLILLSECFHVPIDSLLHEVPDGKAPEGKAPGSRMPDNEVKDKKLKFLWNQATKNEKDMILSIINVIIKKSHNN